MNLIRAIFIDSSGHRARPRAGWRILVGLASMMVVIAVIAIAVDATEISYIESFLWQLLAAPSLIGLAWLLARMDRRPPAAYGAVWQPLGLGAGTLIGAGLIAVIWLLLRGLGWIEIGESFHNTFTIPFGAGFLGYLLRYAGVAVFEELFFRGFLITNLAEGLGGTRPRRTLACFLAAAVFGLLHLTNEGAPPLTALNIALLGLLFGLPFIWTGKLALSMGLHFAWNFFLGPVFGLPVSGYAPRVSLLASTDTGPVLWTGGEFGPEGGLLATLVLVAALAVAIAVKRPHP